MMETYYVGAYWGARQETVAECARRAELFFHALKRCDPSWTQWFRAAHRPTRELPGHPVRTDDAQALGELLERGRNRTDFGKKVIEELGFNFRLWNQWSENTTLSVTCGSHSWGGHNLCLAELPSQGSHAERLLSAPVLAQALHAMAVAWTPEWGIATSETHRDEVLNNSAPGAFIGWINYFSRARGTVPPLPAPVRIEPVGTLGTLVILTPERFTASNPEHLSLAEQVQTLLSRAGLLGPLHP